MLIPNSFAASLRVISFSISTVTSFLHHHIIKPSALVAVGTNFLLYLAGIEPAQIISACVSEITHTDAAKTYNSCLGFLTK